jgi:tRNA threonylcarbamoyladenosine biosynthesis protein TsaB
MYLTIRTDKPEAEVGVYDGATQRSYYKWEANRKLAKELLATIRDELQKNSADWKDVAGVVVYQGPGSFTGLRIGVTVADSIAYGNNIPIVGAQGDDWIATGTARLLAGETDKLVLPHYGAEANITISTKK